MTAAIIRRMATRRPLTVRLTDAEWSMLDSLVKRSGFSQTELVRRAIRELARRGITVNPVDAADADDNTADE